MFNKVEKDRIWSNINYSKTGLFKDEKPVNSKLDEIEIPFLESIYETSLCRFKEIGYYTKRVAPKKANCIVRTYRGEKEHDGCRHWLYGVEVYLKTPIGMISSLDTKINYCEFKVIIWICQDDSFPIHPQYTDYFLQIC